jgi:cytochrome c oxidase assembly protein subunit 15
VTDNQVKPEKTDKAETGIAQAKLSGWFMFLTLSVFTLILWGGFVRLTGSGLSIPEWPLVNGSLLPPLSDNDWQAVYATYQKELYNISDITLPTEMPLGRFKMIFGIEYIHRFLAALVGILFLMALIKAVRRPSVWQQVRWHIIASAVLLLGQATLGGVVVKQALQAELIAVHLGIAFVFFGLLLWIALLLLRSAEVSRPASKNRLSLFAWLATAAILLQIVSGGLTAGTKAGFIFNTFPKMGDFLVPPFYILFSPGFGGFFDNLFKNQILIQFIHRWWAFAALIFVIALTIKGLNASLTARGRMALRIVGTLTVFQILWGILNLLLKVPAWVSLVHLGTALIIFGLLVLIAHESRYEYAKEAV